MNNNIHNVLENAPDYFTRVHNIQISSDVFLERRYFYAMSMLAHIKRFNALSENQKNRAAICVDKFIRAIGEGFSFEDVFEMRRFTNNSIRVYFKEREDVLLNLLFNMDDEDQDESNEAMLVYKDGDDSIIVNDSVINIVEIIKGLLEK